MGVFREMLKEEWRMHSSIFGSLRFALSPLVILAVSAALFAGLPRLGVSTVEIQFGMHFFVLFLGMNVGGIGFISRSGMRNVLEDFNLLLFSSRTLPVSRYRVLVAFVAKDVVYYLFYFILPLAAGTLLLSPSLQVFLVTVLSYVLAFTAGIAAVFLLSTVYARTRKPVFTAGVAAVAAAYYVSGLSLQALNPAYGFYRSPSVQTFLLAAAPVAAVLLAGVYLFEYGERQRPERHRRGYGVLWRWVRPLTAKNLLDLHRSSGGYGKILVSFGVLFGVFWFLVSEFPLGSLFREAPLLSFGALLGMASASIYNWLNRFDAVDRYLHLPLDEDAVLRSKLRSFGLVGLPLIVAGDVLAFLILTPPLPQLVHAVLISVTASVYLIAVMVHLTGLDPARMMFEVSVLVRFLVYSSVLIVPLLVLSMLYTAYPFHASLGLAMLYPVAGSVAAYTLYREVGGARMGRR